MSKEKKRSTNIITSLFTVFDVFILLKLFGAIDWSWWAVFTPLLIIAGLTVLAFTTLGIVSTLEKD